MENDFSAQDIADLLEQCIEGNTPSASVVNELLKMQFFGEEEIVNSAIHCLSHFITDEDIRMDDEEYNQQCKVKLKGYVSQLRQLRTNATRHGERSEDA